MSDKIDNNTMPLLTSTESDEPQSSLLQTLQPGIVDTNPDRSPWDSHSFQIYNKHPTKGYILTGEDAFVVESLDFDLEAAFEVVDEDEVMKKFEECVRKGGIAVRGKMAQRTEALKQNSEDSAKQSTGSESNQTGREHGSGSKAGPKPILAKEGATNTGSKGPLLSAAPVTKKERYETLFLDHRCITLMN
ncbi:MAG: hypothetical protein Q9227_002916 [Pyrenula ochraceoflavens]